MHVIMYMYVTYTHNKHTDQCPLVHLFIIFGVSVFSGFCLAFLFSFTVGLYFLIVHQFFATCFETS